MDAIWQAISPHSPTQEQYSDLHYWVDPELSGWLYKQGEVILTWRRRWFVLKQGKLLWFKDSTVSSTTKPRGVVTLSCCTCVKDAKDIINKPNSFVIVSGGVAKFFVAEDEKDMGKWTKSIAKCIVQQSYCSVTPEIYDYTTPR